MVKFLTKANAKKIIEELIECGSNKEIDECINANRNYYETDILFIHKLYEALENPEIFDEDITNQPPTYYVHQIPVEEVIFENKAEKYWYLRATLYQYTQKPKRRTPKVNDLPYLLSQLGNASSETSGILVGEKMKGKIIDLILQLKEQLYQPYTFAMITDSDIAYLSAALFFTKNEPEFLIAIGKQVEMYYTLDILVNTTKVRKNFFINNRKSVEELVKKFKIKSDDFGSIYSDSYTKYKVAYESKGVENVQDFKRHHLSQLDALSDKINRLDVISDTLKAYKLHVKRNNRHQIMLEKKEEIESTYDEKYSTIRSVLSEIESTVNSKDGVSLLAKENTIDDLVSLILSQDKGSCKEVFMCCEKPLIGYLMYTFAAYCNYKYNQFVQSIASSGKLYTVNGKSKKKQQQKSRTTILGWYNDTNIMLLKDRLMQSDIEKIIDKYFSTKVVRN